LGKHSRWSIGIALAAVLAFTVTGTACGRETGRPRPEGVPPTPSATTSSAPEAGAFDPCEVLTPEDYPFEAHELYPPEPRRLPDGTCVWIARKSRNPLDLLTTSVGTRSNPFREFNPPPAAKNIRSTTIAGRAAWLYSVFQSEVGSACEAAYGSADLTVFVGVDDQTVDHPDPCQTAVQLAEIVAARIPPPNE
jgi:hypothetical protein